MFSTIFSAQRSILEMAQKFWTVNLKGRLTNCRGSFSSSFCQHFDLGAGDWLPRVDTSFGDQVFDATLCQVSGFLGIGMSVSVWNLSERTKQCEFSGQFEFQFFGVKGMNGVVNKEVLHSLLGKN